MKKSLIFIWIITILLDIENMVFQLKKFNNISGALGWFTCIILTIFMIWNIKNK